MKIAEQQHSVKIQGEVKVDEFGFIFNGKMAQLLSDSLYNDKIKAVVRELSTNAYDSHVEAGNQLKPFDVHLPNDDEPYFYIRDYGVGMSPERVDKIYRFYGASDRTESNEFTGGMGLGSKVPFCYHTKTFTVDVWYNGVHTCYSCFIGESGKPNIAKMSEGPSDDPSGVMVKLQVRSCDQRDFEYAAQKIYPHFPVTPNFIGRKRPQIVKPNYVLSANDNVWRLRSNDGNNCRVIMGNVAYPVKFDDTNVTQAHRNVMSSCFDIFADVGTLSVDIGREGLSYDNRTKARINNLINRIVDDFNKRIQEEIEKAPNLWEARKKYADLYDKAEVRVMDGSKITYQGRKLFDGLNNTVSFEHLTKRPHDPKTNVWGEPLMTVLGINHMSWRKNSYEKTRNVNSVNVKRNVVFCENDLNIGAYVRAGELSRQEDCLVLLFKFNDPSARQQVIETLGCDESYFRKISDVESPTVRGATGKRGGFGRVVAFRTTMGTDETYSSVYWEKDQQVDFEVDGGLYVEFNRFSYCNVMGVMAHPRELASLVVLAKSVGITVPVIYGIKTADIPRVANQPKWQNLHDYLKELLAKILPSVDITKIRYYETQLNSICRYNYYSSRNGQYRLSCELLKKIRGKCTKTSEFTVFVDTVIASQKELKDLDKADNLLSLANKLGMVLPKYPQFCHVELDKMESQVYNKYGMLGFLSLDEDSKTDLSKVAAYIDLVS